MKRSAALTALPILTLFLGIFIRTSYAAAQATVSQPSSLRGIIIVLLVCAECYFIYLIIKVIKNKNLRDTLYKHCDPEKYIAAINKAYPEKRRINNKSYKSIRANANISFMLYAGLSASGRFEEALLELNKITAFTDGRSGNYFKALHLACLTSVYMHLKDTARAEEALEKLRDWMENEELNPGKQKKLTEAYYECAHLLDMAKGEFEGAEAFFIGRFETAQSNHASVYAKYYLGEIYTHFGDTEKAEEAFSYATKYGNKLYIASLAKNNTASTQSRLQESTISDYGNARFRYGLKPLKHMLLILIFSALILSFTLSGPAWKEIRLVFPSSSSIPTSPSSSLPGGYIPDAQDTGSYIANSGCNLYEDEDYLVFKDDNGVYVFDKGKAELLTALPRCTAFTYYSGKVYYTGYDAKSKKRYITEYDPAAGSERKVTEMDNMVISMLAADGRLYYSYRTDPKDKAATELRSIAVDGKGLRYIGARGVENFCIVGNFIYYVKGNGYIRRLTIANSDDEQVTPRTSFPHKFEVKGDSLYFCDDEYFIEKYNLETRESVPVVNTGGWGSDFALDKTILYIDQGDSYKTPAGLYMYDNDIGTSYKVAELELTDYSIHTTEYGVYISPHDLDGSCQLYSVVISGKKAALEQVFNYVPDKTPSTDTVIIAGRWGTIYGGYSDGTWLTHSDAAAYCGGDITFYEYNLTGLIGTVQTTDVEYKEVIEGFADSQTQDMDPYLYDNGSIFYLNVPKPGQYRRPDYTDDPLCYSYLYSAGPECLPEIEVVENTSSILPKIQKLLDKNFGKGKVKARVRIAIRADIDADGNEEIIVNADNNAVYDESDYEKLSDWYSLDCIIESDGSICVIYENYCSDAYPEDSDFEYVQNIIDIDGDGIYEIVTDHRGYESSIIAVHKYDGRELTLVLNYSSGL